MISREMMERFLNKFIFVLYEDNKQLVSCKGTLKDLTNSDCAIETNYNVLVIPLQSIQKIKISKMEM